MLYKKIISKILIFGLCSTSISIHSFASNISVGQNKYAKEISYRIEPKTTWLAWWMKGSFFMNFI